MGENEASRNRLVIHAQNLAMAGDNVQSLALLKVLDGAGRFHLLFMAGFQIHEYLRTSSPLSPSLWADLPELPLEEGDWDMANGHIMVRLACDTWKEGLVLRGETQLGDEVYVILLAPCQALFRHYAERCAPHLLDLARDRGGAA